MIGIVVVSHSRALADAAVGLAREMVDATAAPAIAVAAGLDETTFGTDATAVSAAIEQVDSTDGVLVLLDLGSAVLSGEMALEFLDPDVAGRVRLSSAPLVEGLVAAVVLASTGADLDAVAAEAESGLLAKQSHLDSGGEAAGPSAHEGEAARPDATTEVTVSNPHGLHARPAAKVVTLVRGFDATVTLRNLDTGKGPVPAGSLSAVATLDARQGHRLEVSASGAQATEALRALEDLAGRGFDDVPVSPSSLPAGEAAAAGSGLDLAMGPALVLSASVDTTAYVPGDAGSERFGSARAVDAVRARLEELQRRTAETSGPEAADIFVAQMALLDDPEITTPIDTAIAAGTPAPQAWRERLNAVADQFDGLADAYQRERAADVRSVQASVLRALTGQTEAELDSGGKPVILVVEELDAATAASIDTDAVAGVVTIARGTTGHGVIVASSRGIPLLTGVGADAAAVRTGQLVSFDARTNRFVADMSEEEQQRFPDLVAGRRREREQIVAAAQTSASTRDGTRIPVFANLASIADAESASANGAEGSGLVRTEVLFGDRAVAPTVEEQAETFLALAKSLGGAPLTIRTWDIGGDKPLPFLTQDVEANPFLGERGLRVFRRRPDLLRDQLTAIWRAARETTLRVMFPMVTEPAEVAFARELLAAARGDAAGVDLAVGIMVEVPAAALTVESLAAGLDFVSIGTNDLTQYTMAVDRGNDAVADLADPMSPALLRLIDRVCRHRPPGVEVAVCGDLASRPGVVPLLLGLGVDELSCTPPRVPEVKQAVRATDLGSARELASACLAAPDAATVRHLLAP